jgi:hypothetical protein
MPKPLSFSPDLAQALAAIAAARSVAGNPAEALRTSPADFVAWVNRVTLTMGQLSPGEHLSLDLNDLTYLEGILRDLQSVRALAEIWDRIIQKEQPHPPPPLPGQPRIELVGPHDWVLEWLPKLPEAVGAASVWETKAPAPDPSEWKWDWPLDVATISDAGGRAISSDVSSVIEHSSWMPTLVKLVPIDDASTADLLLLRGEPEAVAAAVRRLHYPRGTPLVLVQSERPDPVSQIRRALDDLDAQFPHAGIAYASVAPRSFGPWFETLTRELTHNNPMDVALFRANREIQSPYTPVLRASSQLLRHATLGQAVTRMARRAESFGGRTMAIPPGTSAATVLGREGQVPASEVATRLGRTPRDEDFARETGLATAAAEIREATPAPPPAHRFLLTKLQIQRGEEKQDVETWLAGAVNILSVQVAPEKAGWLVPEVAARLPFPVEGVLGDEESAEAEVTCDVKGVLKRPLRQSITLRRLGESSICQFPISVPKNRKTLTARVTVTYAGRIIQSGLFTGPVTTRLGSGTVKKARWILDAVIRSDLRGLARRRRFDTPLLLEAGSLRATNPSSGAAFTAPARVRAILQYLDTTLSDYADNPETYKGGLGDGDVLTTLINLAALGADLREQLEDVSALVSGRKIQVVSTSPDARLPIELLYDGDGPIKKAKLCKHAVKSLQSRRAQCGCGDVTTERVFCPYRFWGISRVIERHLEASGRDDVGGDFVLRPEPTPEEKLELFRGSLVAGSERVTKHVKNGIAALQKQLAGIKAAGGSDVVTTWNGWVKAVKSSAPSLLLLLPHTEADGPLTVLEIQGDLLPAANIQEKHIGTVAQKPVVMILGCETDRDPAEFLDIVARCRRKNAAIIVVFGATLAAEAAVPAAKELIKQMDRARRLPRPTLGEAMLGARQALVGKGWVPALGLVAYGDADWVLA